MSLTKCPLCMKVVPLDEARAGATQRCPACGQTFLARPLGGELPVVEPVQTEASVPFAIKPETEPVRPIASQTEASVPFAIKPEAAPFAIKPEAEPARPIAPLPFFPEEDRRAERKAPKADDKEREREPGLLTVAEKLVKRLSPEEREALDRRLVLRQRFWLFLTLSILVIVGVTSVLSLQLFPNSPESSSSLPLKIITGTALVAMLFGYYFEHRVKDVEVVATLVIFISAVVLIYIAAFVPGEGLDFGRPFEFFEMLGHSSLAYAWWERGVGVLQLLAVLVMFATTARWRWCCRQTT